MKKTFLILFFIAGIYSSVYSQCWKSITAGNSNFFAIAENGTLWAWGRNTYGELGEGTNSQRSTPVQIGTDTNWKEISASINPIASFTLGVKTDGTLWAWGNNERGQLGDGTLLNRNSPVQVGSDTDWKTVTAGFTHSIGIKQNGTLWGWGSSERFALIGFPSGINVLVPEQRNMDTDWVQASAHDRVTVAVKSDKTVWCWGWNHDNFLDVPFGSVITNNIQYPAKKNFSTNVKYTTTGDRRSFDVNENNLVINPNDPLNNNPAYVKHLDTGNSTLVYIPLNNGTLRSAGYRLGSSGQTSGDFQLSSANNWKLVSVGGESAGAINNNGELYVWGSNFDGQLGNGGSGTSSILPLLVSCPSVLSNEKFTTETSIKVYPNPIKDKLTIESIVSIERIVIIDVFGKEIYNEITNDTNVEINLSRLDQGVYFALVYANGIQKPIKIIKN
ncbi:T9SS type A sorting domain-containing protein [Flavobacterium sp. J27]|uniref:T9SS type A sorting domain-containing protein n=1 Tax=Flavobacterium sp. J27 TaxID=2060419 RepID=UPI001030D68B|nr:T9SS type A sorting domain-containing protein [Flavobacterium sp. J27]